MRLGLRGRLLLACVTPCVVVAIFAAIPLPPWVVAAVATSAVLVVAGSVYALPAVVIVLDFGMTAQVLN